MLKNKGMSIGVFHLERELCQVLSHLRTFIGLTTDFSKKVCDSMSYRASESEILYQLGAFMIADVLPHTRCV